MNEPLPNLAGALESLPHGPEFCFVDRLTALTPGQRGTAVYTVRGDEPFLRGHFPGEPLFPGVLLIEAVAQLAGLVAQTDPKIPPLHGLRLTAVRQAKITGSAEPGHAMNLTAEIIGRMGNLIQARGEVAVDGRVVLVAEVTLAGGS